MALTLEQARQNALNRRKSIMLQTAQQNITAEENKPENTGGLLGGVGYTLGRVGLGALRGLEGIWDFAAGGIADLFGADEWAYEQATESPFDDLTTELDAWYNPSEFMQFAGDVGAGVGQMLPSVAVAAIPGAGPALSAAMFTTSAAGMGVSDAAKTTGELGAKEWLYGGASGAVEGAIEKLSGGIGGTKLGTVLGKQVAKSTAGKVAATFVGEGLEEVASDLIDPALRRVTGVDPEATVDVEQLPNTFLVGGAAGALLGGGSRVVNAARSGGFNNLNAREDLATIREAQSRGNTLQNEGKLNAKWESTLSSKQTEAEQRLSSRLQKMDAETRGKFISDNNLGSVFDADGNIRTAAEGYTAPKYNADAVSFSAREDLNRGTLQYAPTQKAVREDIKSAISDVTKISDGQGKYVVVDTLGTTSAGQKINGFYDRSTGVTYIANDGDTNGTKSFVVSHEYVHTLEGTNAYNKYANEIIKQIESDPALKEKYNIDAYVETYRKAQPDYESETIAYIAQTEMVADFTANEILSNEDAVRRLANRNKSLVTRVYEWVKDKIKTLTSKGGSRENIAYLRKAERMLAKVLDMPTGGVDIQKEDQEIKEQKAETEAAEAGEARRLKTNKEPATEIRFSLMNERSFNENVDDILSMSDAEARANVEAGNFVSIMKHTPDVILNNVEGAEDLEVIIRFDALYLASREEGALEGHYHALGAEITKQLPELISNPDAIVRMDNGRLNIFAEMRMPNSKNGIISVELNTVKDINSKNTKYNLVVSAFSAKDNYVRNLLQKRAERVEYMKKDLSQLKPQLYEWLASVNERSNGSSQVNHQLHESLATVNEKSNGSSTTTNSIRDNTKKVNNNVENSGERFSISVDSEGNTLSEQQQEYFKDSKVRDESGNLLPVYHGSPKEFFVFDRNRMGKGNDQFGAGFYFATDEDASRHYGDKVIKSYLNIQKPIVINRTEDGGDLYDVHLTQKQAYEILKRHPKIYDAEESPLGDLFDEYWEVGPKDYMIRQAAKNLDSIGLMDSDYTAFRNYPNELHEAIREVLGYDGVEVRFAGSNEKFYVAWFENQIKQTSNKNPTGSADIRYSISQNQNTRDENYINNKLKTYTYADVESIVDNLTINKYGDDVVLRGKKNVGKQIYTLLNETPIRNRRAKAEQIARQIVYQNLAAQSLYNAEEIENARKDGIEISETWIDKKLSSQLSETENEALVKEIRDELLDSFETAGKLNATGKMYLRYKEVGDRLSKLLVKDSILKTARRMKKRNYPKAFEAFDGIRKILAKLEMRSDINEESGRDIIKAFGEFYTASNEALQGYYSEEVRQAIDDFISYNGEGNLDLYELEQIDTILNAADHLLKEYDKAFLNGRTVSVTKTSNDAVNTVKENADLYKATVLGAMRLKGYVGSFFRSIVDTRTLAMWLDGGNKGIITELFEDIAKASTKQTITVMDLYDDFDKFIKKNKKFYKSLEQKVTFKFNGKDVEITRGEAISLYLTSLQEDGLYHLAFGGFAVGKDQNNIRRYIGQKPLYGTPEDVEQYESEVMQQAKKEFSALYDTFTETEKEYIRLARDLFNNKAKRIKQEIDIKRIGMTNANVENYFPERVYEVGRPLKQGNTYIQEMNLIANQSIHKDRVKGSKQTLYISPVNMVVMNHIRQIAMYNAYAIPIDTLRRVMNKNVSLTFDGKPNTAQAETLKTVIQETAWADFEKFLDKYMMDVQGGSFSNTTPDKIIRWMRSNYAKFQLGLNIKTMLSQLTSLPMAGSRLGWKNLLKGTFAKPNFEEMLKYSEWARARNYEGAAYKSQSLVDNVDKVGQLAMKPIGMVDLFTMNRIYNAAKYYIASRDGISLDSVECKTKAAAMLEEIGRETQNNSEAAEKSALMRSGNELIKSIVMFSSDAMKQFSSLMQALNKIKFIKQKIKLGKGDKVALEKQLSAARKEARGAFASVGVSSAMYVLMGMLVNYGLFAKEPEDDESYIEIFLKNFGGSVTGMIPVVRDLYSFFVDGYELDNFAYETVNGLSEAVKNIGTLMERAGSGERVTDQEWMLAMRKFIYAAGQITGLPTRNLYNQIYGLIKRVSPSAAYDINSIFYGASTKDLDKAIQKGDTALSTTIAEQLLSDKGIDASKKVASAFSDLYSKGYSMPKGIPESITYNEEEISLNAKQQGIVIDAYSEAANKAEGLINSADWASLSDEAKANALKLLFNYYYYYGINKATGAYADNRTLLLGSAIDITKIASAYGQIAELTADTDKKGNVISGTKKAKVQRLVNSLRLSAAQKYILMGFLGYKNSNGESSVTSYIRNIGISQDMQTALLEMSGYEVS